MKKFSLVIGNFDGVHRGHRELLLRSKAEIGEELWVLTFDPHPAAFLRPQEAPARILDIFQKDRDLRTAGVDHIQTLKFNNELVALSGREFFDQCVRGLGPRQVSVGTDFRFGRGRSAGVDELRAFCQESGISFQGVEPVREGGLVVSSSLIRQHLARRDFQSARSLMGRDFSIRGLVRQGRQLGRTIGFPTANLQLPPERQGRLPVPNGVYGGRHETLGVFMMNIGWAPTVSENRDLKVEVHFTEGAPDLYGRDLEVAPTLYVRDEQKFSSVEELRRQIEQDRQTVLRQIRGSH